MRDVGRIAPSDVEVFSDVVLHSDVKLSDDVIAFSGDDASIEEITPSFIAQLTQVLEEIVKLAPPRRPKVPLRFDSAEIPTFSIVDYVKR